MQTEKKTLTANDTTSIVVADKRVHSSAIVEYSCRRGALAQAGKLTLMNKVSSVDVDVASTGDDMGLTFTGSFSSNDIQLDCALTAGNDVVLSYNFKTLGL